MKNYLKIIVLFGILVVIIPAAVIFIKPVGNNEAYPVIGEVGTVRDIKILDEASGEITEVPVEKYVIDSVFALMPASYSEEALKAQAVLVRTYAVLRQESEKTNPTAELLGADLSNDFTKYQKYFTDEQAENYYGDSYSEMYAKISEAVNQTSGQILTYEGEPIVAAFHAVSPGKTVSAEDVWGIPLPYMQSVESPGDILAENYLTVKEMSADEVFARLVTSIEGLTLSENKSHWLALGDKTAAGYVKQVWLDDSGLSISGVEAARILNLPSACFTFKYDAEENTFIFNVKGAGHLAGMSQFGANEMAKGGSSYKEILAHYFSGTELSENLS